LETDYTMKKSTMQGMALVVSSVLVTLLGLELSLRVYHGIASPSELPTPPAVKPVARLQYDSTLGWLPKIGQSGTGWIANVDTGGLRSNGPSMVAEGKPVLVIGDSFTFGDEVADHETWAAQLERVLQKRVLNGGVSAYGIDQAVLRSERLLDRHQPEVVILSFVSNDVDRTEFSYVPWGHGWKPYFDLVNDSLRLRNVPVPQTRIPGRYPALRRAVNHSHFAAFVLSRTAPRWWRNLPPVKRVHTDGDKVSVALLARMDSLAKSRGAQFIAVAFAVGGIDDNGRLASVTGRARERGILVLDLSAETLKLRPDTLKRLFRPGGHYTPAKNVWVAERISAFLRENNMVALPVRRGAGRRAASASDAALE